MPYRHAHYVFTYAVHCLKVAAMRGGEDLSGRRRRTSSRGGSFCGSFAVGSAVVASSTVSLSGPAAAGANTVDVVAAGALVRCSDRGPTSDHTAVQSAQPRAAEPSADSAARSDADAAEPEASHRLHDNSNCNDASHGVGSLAGRVTVAWQPGIESLLEGMQQDMDQGKPTEARRLSDSAADGPRSYPLSPTSLAAVSPGPQLQQRDDGIPAVHPAAETSRFAATVYAGLPAPAQVSAYMENTTVHTRLNGWAVPPHAAHAAPDVAIGVAAERLGKSSLTASSIPLRPLEKQPSNMAAMQAVTPGKQVCVSAARHVTEIMALASLAVSRMAPCLQ